MYLQGFGFCCIVEITVVESCLDTGTQCYMHCPDILKVILMLEPNATCIQLLPGHFESYPDMESNANKNPFSLCPDILAGVSDTPTMAVPIVTVGTACICESQKNTVL